MDNPVPRDYAKIPYSFKICPFCNIGALKPIWDSAGHTYEGYVCNKCKAEVSRSDYAALPKEAK